MQTSTTSSNPAGDVREGTLRLVGNTPLIALEHSGEGRVFIKHEGYNLGGSFFDRVALRHLAESPPSIVVRGGGALAVSVAAVAASRVPVRVLGGGDDLRRVRKLIAAFGAQADPGDPGDAIERAVAAGATLIVREEPAPILDSLRDVASEVTEAGVCPGLWVLPDYGLDPSDVREALTVDGEEPFLELITDDRDERRTLSGPAAYRRVQMGHREGLLLSPLGAEIAEAAIQASSEVAGIVVALIPEGGHRYLGWW